MSRINSLEKSSVLSRQRSEVPQRGRKIFAGSGIFERRGGTFIALLARGDCAGITGKQKCISGCPWQ